MRVLKALALATVPIVGAFACLLLFQVSAAVVQIRHDEREVFADVIGAVSEAGITATSIGHTAAAGTRTLDSLNATVRTLNRPCGTPKPCGTLADVAKTLHTIRGATGQIEVAARHENRNLSTLDGQEVTLFEDAHQTLGSARDVMASPAVTASLANLQASTAAVAVSTKQAAAILTDGREEADKFVHPPKKKLTFWGAVMAAAGVVHKFEPPIF